MMSLQLPGFLFKALSELSEQEDKTIKGLIVDILVEHCDKQGYPRPSYYLFKRERDNDKVSTTNLQP